MVSHRPRKRTWTNQTKGDQRRKNLGEKGPMNAVQHSPCAKSAARGGAQRSLRHHRRLQRSEVDGLRALLRDKFYIASSSKRARPRAKTATLKRKAERIEPPPKKTLKRPSRRPSGSHTGWSKNIHRVGHRRRCTSHRTERNKNNAIGHRRDKVATTT